MGYIKTVKQKAKALLRENFGNILGAVGILYVTNIAVSTLTAVFSSPFSDTQTLEGSGVSVILSYVQLAISVFLIAPLTMGVVRYLYLLARGGTPSLSQMFFYFEKGWSYSRALKTYIQVFVRMIGYSLAVFVPYTIIMLMFFASIFRNIVSAQGLLVDGIISVIMIIFLSIVALGVIYIISLRFFLVDYLIVDMRHTPSTAVNFSKNMMRDYTFKVVKLYLSFIPWLLSCVFIVPALYVIPYMFTATAVMADFIIEAESKKLERERV